MKISRLVGRLKAVALAVAVAGAVVGATPNNASAFTVEHTKHPFKNATYKYDSIFTGNGPTWATELASAAVSWNSTGFLWTNTGTSVNTVSSGTLACGDPGVTGSLGTVSMSSDSQLLNTSFLMYINTGCAYPYHASSAMPVPLNYYDLRTVLARYLGYAAGLGNTNLAGQMMSQVPLKGVRQTPGADESNGMHWIYDDYMDVNGTITPEGISWQGNYKPPTSGYGYYDESNPVSTAYGGSTLWVTVQNAKAEYGHYRYAGSAGTAKSRVSFPFNGTTITWGTNQATNRGASRVYIDGVLVGTYSNYAPNTRMQVYRTFSVPAGNHVIQVSSYGNGWSDVDAFNVDQIAGAGPYICDNQCGNLRYYGSGWWVNSGPSYLGGTTTLTSDANDGVQFNFTGTQIKLYYTSAANRAKFSITVDGNDYGIIDAYSATTQFQRQILIGNLGAGKHQIVINNTGLRNPSSTGWFTDIDAVEVIP